MVSNKAWATSSSGWLLASLWYAFRTTGSIRENSVQGKFHGCIVVLACVFGEEVGSVGFSSVGFCWLVVSLSGWLFAAWFSYFMVVLIGS